MMSLTIVCAKSGDPVTGREPSSQTLDDCVSTLRHVWHQHEASGITPCECTTNGEKPMLDLHG